MRYSLDSKECRDYSISSRREWLLANGIGGHAAGTVSGANTRRFHGHLIAAAGAGQGAMLLLSQIEAYAEVGATTYGVSTNQYAGKVHPQGYTRLASFAVSDFAEWTFSVGRQTLRKRLGVHVAQNACTVEYTNLGDVTMKLSLRPLVAHKSAQRVFSAQDSYPDHLAYEQDRTVVEHDGVALHLHHDGADRVATFGWYYRFEFPRETERGMQSMDDLFCPCELQYRLEPGESAVIVAATEQGAQQYRFDEAAERTPALVDTLKEAARKFVVTEGGETMVLAGYPAEGATGRDSMLALPGLGLAMAPEQSRAILRRHARHRKDGIVAMTLDGDYASADATLWFINAVYDSLKRDWDEDFAGEAFEWVADSLDHQIEGSINRVRLDDDDGLLQLEYSDVPLTWMNVVIEDSAVTPRHGKPIEVNALWSNALRSAEWIGKKLGQNTARFSELAMLAEESLKSKFWRESLGHYLDTIEPDDASFRPNQVIAMGLPFSCLSGEQAERALDLVRQKLLTPYGLRTLAPDDSRYQGTYLAPFYEPNSALHQGSVWSFLIGFYISAVLRVSGDGQHAATTLDRLADQMESYGMGGIAQLYDGDEPHGEAGLPWYAWSVSEALRACYELRAFTQGRNGG